MEVRAGYKQTDVGIIPEDWSAISLAKTCRRITRGASPRPIESPIWFDQESNIGWVRISDVTKSNRYLLKTVQKLSKAGVQNSRFVSSGSLIMSICATVGRPIETRLDVCIHDGFVVFEDPHIDQAFLYHVLADLEPTWSSSGQTGSQMNLNTRLVNNRNVAIPSSHIEQHAIAAALSDMDAMLSGLERLIAKKRALKQAAIQQLLTCQIRLPGFSGEWKVKRLKNTATLKARIGWQGLTTSEYLDTGDYYLVTGTEFTNGYIDWNSCHFVDHSRYMQDKYIQLKKHDVLVTKDGTIGKVALVNDLPRPATLNSGVFLIRPIDKAFHPEYFYYLLSSSAFKEFLAQLSAGSTINHLYQKDFVNFTYKVPVSIEEQIAIATVLSDMDIELSALEARRDKTRALKQAMMQELLTGKTRLISPEVIHA